jgi:hypothetical protein
MSTFTHLIPAKALTNKSIILDIDETLVHTEDDISSLDEMGIMEDEELSQEVYFLDLDEGETKMWGTKRPHLDEFLLFCFTYFENVCVWSAGQRDYVHAMVDVLFEPFRKPDVVFTFDDCVKKNGEYWIKPLEKFFKREGDRIKPSSSFIIDDRSYTFEENHQNGILIPAYSPTSLEEIQKEEDHLTRLQMWFLHPERRFSQDVRSLNKDQIFDKEVKNAKRELKNIYLK